MAASSPKNPEYKIKRHLQPPEPQQNIQSIWKDFLSQSSGFVRAILPPHESAEQQHNITDTDEHEAGSYEAARRACILEVTSIVRECERRNEMFTDPDFDIFGDFNINRHDCLYPLEIPEKPKDGSKKEQEKKQKKKHEKEQEMESDGSEVDHGALAQIQCADCSQQLSHGMAPKGRAFGSVGSVRRVHEIFECPCFAPSAPRKYIPPLDHRIITWRSIAQWVVKIQSVLRILLAALMGLKLFGLSWSLFLTSATFIALLMAPLFAFLKAKPGLLGPQFSSSHISQGGVGNCWWICAVAALCSRNDLLCRTCVAWDQNCGVYGFLFYRDGAWIHTVVDDCLYSPLNEDIIFDERSMAPMRRKKGSEFLFFATCGRSNYTWLPLLEKAYAKVHGDYESLKGGIPVEGIEDLTGGVGSAVRPSNLKDREQVWRDLCQMDREHVYALSTSNHELKYERAGLVHRHAYSVEKACTFFFDGWWPKKTRLLRIRNPWGTQAGRWKGSWGPESLKWNLLSMFWLRYRTGDDGVFYMTFEDALKSFDFVYRLRLFDDPDWNIKQAWVNMSVDWIPQYNPVFFEVKLTKDSEVVLAVSQLDSRYFHALKGRYSFHLETLVKRKGSAYAVFIARSAVPDLYSDLSARSADIETQLTAGVYEVLVKITAVCRKGEKDAVWSVEDVVKQSLAKPHKLQQTARNYDTAHKKLRTINPGATDPNTASSTASGKEVDVTRVYPDAEEVTWQAVCGVGLRVFSKDPHMQVELHHRQEPRESEAEALVAKVGGSEEVSRGDADKKRKGSILPTSESKDSDDAEVPKKPCLTRPISQSEE